MVYDIKDNTSTYLGKMDVSWVVRAVITPDKKFVAVNEDANLRGSGLTYAMLKVVKVEGDSEMNAPLLRHIIGGGYVYWIKK